MHRTTQDPINVGTAGVVARPPLIFLGAILLGFVMDHLAPLPRLLPRPGFIHSVSAAVAGSLILVGVALAAAGIRNFSRAGTPVPTNALTRALVTSGIHGWTRNPIYLGFFAMYFAVGIAVRSPWLLIVAAPLATIVRYGVVGREESYLEQRFEHAYRDYKMRVRRWL